MRNDDFAVINGYGYRDMNETFLTTIVFSLCCFLFLLNKKRQHKKVRQQLESWNYWIQVVNDDFAPYFSGKIIKQSKDYHFLAVGCVHKSELGSDFKKHLTDKIGLLPDLIPCQCILHPTKLTMGEMDLEQISLIYNNIPTDKGQCLKIGLDGADIIYSDTDEDIANFNKVWGLELMKEMDGVNEDAIFKFFI
ncbi:hypothetical protein BCT42_23185 [Vibrio lentus]|nr:hypothetical protein BCU40_07620 [Vibrio lentus]PMN00433.1 hypothetical protein BCT42_23185 [Vibrio lentus]